MAYVLISILLCGDTNKQIKARVSRLWNFHDMNDETKVYHTNLVLLDEMGSSIHVQIYPAVMQKFKALLQEGKVYYIDSFSVRYANRTYRPVTNPLMILFTKWTTLEECIDVPDGYPGITFSLTPFGDIPSLVDKNIFYVDVMGVIPEISNTATVRPRSSNTDSLKRTVHICDASNTTLPVTLWGKTAAAFDAEEVHKAGQTKPQLIVCVGTLVRNYAGIGITLTGSSPCKWYIGLDMPEALELKQSFEANFQPIKWVEDAALGFRQDVPQEKTIQDILALNPHKHQQERYIVNVTVKGIAGGSSWWYNSCDLCYRTSKPYGSTYRCTSCSYVGIPVPRYKVLLTAADHTGKATFILFGRTAQRLIRKPVEILIEQNPPDSEFIPDEITALINQSFVWNVSFTQDALMRNQDSLQVNSILSSNGPTNPVLSDSSAASEETLAVILPGSSSSVPAAPIASETSTESKIEPKEKGAVSAGQTPATPTKYIAKPPLDHTPTSKYNAPSLGKKSYVLSVSPIPAQPKQATIEAGTKARAIQLTSSVELPPSGAEDKAKEPTQPTHDPPSPASSLVAKDTQKKRDRPAASTLVAKKLFKDDNYNKIDKSQ